MIPNGKDMMLLERVNLIPKILTLNLIGQIETSQSFNTTSEGSTNNTGLTMTRIKMVEVGEDMVTEVTGTGMMIREDISML